MSGKSERLPGEPIPLAPPIEQFNCYLMVDQNTKGPWVGGSYDNISAVTIACAFYQSYMRHAPEPLVGVFDSSDSVIAFIGTLGS